MIGVCNQNKHCW